MLRDNYSDNTNITATILNWGVWVASASWVRKVGGAGSCSFPTDAANFGQRKLYGCPKFQSCPNFPKMAVSSYKICILDEYFPTTRRFSENFPQPKI